MLLKVTPGWCPDCRILRPHFEREADRAAEAGVSVVRFAVQGDAKAFITASHEDFALEHGIRNYPWVGLFNNGKLVSATVEETTGDGFSKWLDYALSRIHK